MEIPLSSPFYLHPSENPSVVLVQPVLEEKEYHSWARSFRMGLLSKNKEGFIDGSIKMPAPNDAKFEAWRQCNNMVFRWLLNSVSPTIARSVMWMNIAEEVWKDLFERFSSGDAFRLTDLAEEIHAVRQGDMTVTQYYTKLKMLWEEYLILRPLPVCSCDPQCNCGAVKSSRENFESDCTIRFAKGLNENFASLKSQVPLMTPIPSVNKIFGMALKCETQMSFGQESTIMSAKGFQGYGESVGTSFASQAMGRGSQNSSYGRGTQGSNNGFTPQLRGKRLQCVFCGRTGHTIERCYQRIGFPPNSKGRGRGEARANQAFVDSELEVDTGDQILSTKQPEFSVDQLNQAMNLLRVLQHQGMMPQQGGAKDQQAAAEQATVLSASFNGAADTVEGHCIQEDDWIS